MEIFCAPFIKVMSLSLFTFLNRRKLKLRYLNLHTLFSAFITYEVLRYGIILSCSGHILPSCCHESGAGLNVISSRTIYDLRSNNAGLFTLEVGKTQSLTFLAVTPKTDCDSCCRLWSNIGEMCDRICERELLIAAARASGRVVAWRGVAYCLTTLLQMPVDVECKYKASHYAVSFVTCDFVVQCGDES